MRRTITSFVIAIAMLMPAALFGRSQKTMNTKLATVLLPNRSPLVSLRLVFMSGAASTLR